jgi:hypothetical protein
MEHRGKSPTHMFTWPAGCSVMTVMSLKHMLREAALCVDAGPETNFNP